MTAELPSTTLTYRREDFWTVDWPATINASGERYRPAQVRVELTRNAEHEPWRVLWVLVTGPNIKNDGTEGVLTREGGCWTARDWTEAPQRVRALAAESLADAERERLNRSSTFPMCPPGSSPATIEPTSSMTAVTEGHIEVPVTLVIDLNPDIWREVTEFDGEYVAQNVRDYVWEKVSNGRDCYLGDAGAGVSLKGNRGRTVQAVERWR